MATMILSTAGASFGSAAGGSLLGLGAATVGRAAGGVAGSLIDRQVMGRGAQPVETGRVDRIRVQGAGEGEPIPRLFGRMRIAGQVIWSSRFTEHIDETSRGGKGGGQKTREYRYSVSFAVALCEGRIRRIGRAWADGIEISLTGFQYRLHRGGANQQPDPLIDDIEGGAPAFRDLAYLVFEDMALGPFGNRIPQLNIEVWREPETAPTPANEIAPAFAELVRGVAMSPGSGEFSLETRKVRRLIGPGQSVYENVNTVAERPDIMIGLDQLQTEAPNCGAVSLIVSWFGDDLRCGQCEIRPCVETADKDTDPIKWVVNGVERRNAKVVSVDAQGRPVYGGTPGDGSVIRSIQEMKSRGLEVMFYPFVLMDVPAHNQKPDPWTDDIGQPAFPWRGRITLSRAPGVVGSPDKSAAAADQVNAFFGTAARSDFSMGDDTVNYEGSSEWSFRRFILHYANLCALAGGVDSFCIGSEMRGLTQTRSSEDSYPAVGELRALAADVRAILGPDTKVGYAADWSEYFGHQPKDGSGDVFFHLDPLWADQNIDFIGIDNYLPLSDWRYHEGHADENAKSVYALSYLSDNVEGGEGYDWYYRSAAARDAQDRTPIVDGAHGEDWLFRPKDIRNWWRNQHHNRPGGVRATNPTEWTPKAKPIWFTEIGCPAVDLGANQPNVFVDPKSSENALPYFSRGVRDDFMQRRYLEAALSHWEKPENNPTSPVYNDRMIRLDRIFIWTWDARPWPDFPNRLSVWSDGPSYRLGHWISGRLGAASLADVVAEICLRAGLAAFDVSELYGVVQGFQIDDARSARAALQSLMTVFAFDVVESGEVVRFRHRDRLLDASLALQDAVGSREGGADITFVRTPEGDLASAVSFEFVDSERDYEIGALEARSVASISTRTETSGAPVLLDSGAAQDVADRHLAESIVGREGVSFVAARRWLSLEPGDIVRLGSALGEPRFRIDGIEDAGARVLTLTAVDPKAYAVAPQRFSPPTLEPVFPAAPVASVLMDLPLIAGDEAGPSIAAFAKPWSGPATLFVGNDGESFQQVARIVRPAVMGVLTSALPASTSDVWTRDIFCEVKLFGGGLSSKPDVAVLNGANVAAVKSPSGNWEVIQFQTADLVGENLWRLSRLLRGQAGTETFIGDPTPVGSAFVLLDDALVTVESPFSFRGIERVWRIGPSRKPFSDESYTQFLAEDTGERMRPYAPAHLRARRDSMSGDIAISWIRRTRIDGDSWAGAEVPIGEEREAYCVRIGLLREIETTEAQWIWSAAAQANDGISGVVEISVSQISSQFGPGAETKVMINV